MDPKKTWDICDKIFKLISMALSIGVIHGLNRNVGNSYANFIILIIMSTFLFGLLSQLAEISLFIHEKILLFCNEAIIDRYSRFVAVILALIIAGLLMWWSISFASSALIELTKLRQ